MAKYAVLKSPINELILSSALADGLVKEVKEEADAIIFIVEDEDVPSLFKYLQRKLIELGLAHNEAYASQLSSSFFLNKLS